MTISNVLTAVLTGGIFAFLQFLITRNDNRDEEKKKIEEAIKDIRVQLIKGEKDTLRTQLLLLILMRPEEVHEILTIGEQYFKVLKGNWYMTSIFKKWLKENSVEEPEWFDRRGGSE